MSSEETPEGNSTKTLVKGGSYFRLRTQKGPGFSRLFLFNEMNTEVVRLYGPILFVEVDDGLIDWEISDYDYKYIIPNPLVCIVIEAWCNYVGSVVIWSDNQSWAEFVTDYLFDKDKNIVSLQKEHNLNMLIRENLIKQGDVFIDPYPPHEIRGKTIHPRELDGD